MSSQGRERTRAGAGLQTLPPPVIDPADVAALCPWLTPADADLYASLATLVLEAVVWPKTLPAAPLPAPLYAAGLSIAVRSARAGQAAGGGQVVSESVGSYTYRLATPPALEAAFELSEAELELLRPWLGRAKVYDVSVAGERWLVWPADWWQRNLDRAPEPAWLEATP